MTSHTRRPSEHRFLEVLFSVAEPKVWSDLLLQRRSGDPFQYVITPNVDHVVQLSRDAEIAAAYSDAEYRICDSRILQRLAALKGIDLMPYPGADMVNDLLSQPSAAALRIAVLGPDAEDFAMLVKRFAGLRMFRVEAPMMQRGDAAWEQTLVAVEAAHFDLILLCISFPKQEHFAHDLKVRGVARGIGLCAGASLDFLSGKQLRAPKLIRRLSLEWLYRLLTNPRRLWRRYLVDGPKVFRLYLQSGRR